MPVILSAGLPPHNLMLLLLAISFGVLFCYAALLVIRDLNFYSRNGWDWSKDSGTPTAWVRFGPLVYSVLKKYSVFIALPILIMITGGVTALCLRQFLG